MKQNLRSRNTFGHCQSVNFVISEETQKFIDEMMSRRFLFVHKSSRSKKRVEKHYEQFRKRRG